MTDDQTPTDRDLLNEADKQDRYDRNGRRWVWCDRCQAWCEDCCRGYEHRYVLTYPAIEFVNGAFGPLTFAPQPADTSPQPASDDLPASGTEGEEMFKCRTCEQEKPAQGFYGERVIDDYLRLDPKPSKALPPEIDAALTRALADAWDQGYCARHADDVHATYTDNPYRQEQHRSVLSGHGITPREERQ